MQYKFKILVPLLCLCFLSSCYTSQLVSKFSGTQVELGMSQNEFIQKFGKPFNKEMAYTYDKHKRETLFYKEDLYRSWFIVTTALLLSIPNWSAKRLSEKRQFNHEEHPRREKHQSSTTCPRQKFPPIFVPIFNPVILDFQYSQHFTRIFKKAIV